MVDVIRLIEINGAPEHNPAEPGVARYMGEAVRPLRGFSTQEPNGVDSESKAVARIGSLRRKIMKGEPSETLERTVEGSFFPAVLLCSGWWERSQKKPLAETLKWRNDLQHWLFSGFERWGPSLDVNPSGRGGDNYLFGQIGEGDEADSLPVIVAGAKATDIRGQLTASTRAFAVRARGFIKRRRDLTDPEIRQAIRQWGKSFNFCLVIEEDEKNHFIIPISQSTALYSGYLWQCWLPEKFARRRNEHVSGRTILESPRLDEVFFLWEHTNLASSASINYNLDSLSHKAEYLSRDFGGLIPVQKSSDLIEGEQALSREEFYRFILEAPEAGGQPIGTD